MTPRYRAARRGCACGKTTRFEYDAHGNLEAVQSPIGTRVETRRDERGRVKESRDGRGNKTVYDHDEQDNLRVKTDALGGRQTSTFDAIGNKLTEEDEAGRTTTWTYWKGPLVETIVRSGPGGPFDRAFTYDGAGNKTSEKDWRGNTTFYDYDEVHRLKQRREPLGKTTTFGYDGTGNLLTETVGDRTTSHEYDDLGRRTKTTDAEQKVWTFEYDANGNRTATIDALNRRTSMVYDAMNRLKEVNQPLGRSTRYDYDAAGNKTRETDPNGNTTTYDHDSANRLIRTTRPGGDAVGFKYDDANNLERQTDEGGGITQHTHDALNRKTSTTDQEQHVTSYQYDAVGNLTGETWANGNAVTHSYDLFNRRTSTSDALGQVGAWTYDGNGNLVSEEDGRGHRSTHTYDALNHRTGSTLPGERTLKYVPDVFGNVTEATDARGKKTTYRHDKLDRITRTENPDGGAVTVGYDDVGNKTSVTNARGHATTYQFNALNRMIASVDSEGGRMAYEYDHVGNLRTETDKRGTVIEHTYDARNRRLTTRKAEIELEALTYTPLDKVQTRRDANGNRTTYTYDRRGLLTSTAAPEGATTSQSPNSMGDVEVAVDAEGRTTRTAYDKRRRVASVTNPAGETTRYEHDLNGNRTAVVRPAGGRSEFDYDERNALAKVTEPLGRISRYERDKNGNLTRFTDGESRSIAFGYDDLNRRTSITYAGGATQSFQYDFDGNVTQHIDANGVAVTRTFDKLNRERTRSYSASTDGLSSIATTYDANGNELTVTENWSSGARTTTRTYDAFDRELTVQDGFGSRMAYTYDANGNRKTLATQDEKASRSLTHYGFDGLNRLKGLSSLAGSVQYQYDRSGLVREQVNGNGTMTATTYDAASRPKRIALSHNGTVLNLTEYSYDTNGNRTEERINRPGGAQVTTYGYDGADRLTSTRRVDGPNTVQSNWTYDNADNRLTETVASTGANAGTVSRTYSHDARNQLRQITDSAAGTTTLSYDPQGNLTQKVKGSDTTAYVWNARDLLASVSRNGTVLGRYSSDHQGLRVSKEALNPLQPGAPPRVLRTQWDEQNAVEDRDTNGEVVARYDFAGHQPVALWSAEDGSQVLHADALGSVVATTAGGGTVKSETLYDAWGNLIVKAGASANKFAFTGHQADAETGLYYFKARYYDPETGRFISVDPAEGQDGKPASYHKYLYAYANPLAHVDPDGRQAVTAPCLHPVCMLPMFAPSEQQKQANAQLGAKIERALGETIEGVKGWFSKPVSETHVPQPTTTSASLPAGHTSHEQLLGIRAQAVALRDAANAAHRAHEYKTSEEITRQIAELVSRHGDFVSPYERLPEKKHELISRPNNGPLTGLTTETPDKGGVKTLPRLEGKPAEPVDGRIPGYVPHRPGPRDGIMSTPRDVPALPTIILSKSDEDEPKKASELPVINPGTKEWDEAVGALAGTTKGKINLRTKNASDAKALLEEARGGMDRRKQYTRDSYRKGYEAHNQQNDREIGVGNDLQHLKWRDGKAGGHIYYEKPN